MTLARGSRTLKGLGPSRLLGAGAPVSASTISVSRLTRARGRGTGWSPVRPPAAALGCRRRDLMRMSSCKLSLLRTLHPVPAASPVCGEPDLGGGGAGAAAAAAARAQHPTHHPGPLPPAPRVGRLGVEVEPTALCLPERTPAAPLLCPFRAAEGVR